MVQENYQDYLRILKNSLVIDGYSITVAALPVEAEFTTCITPVQKLFYESCSRRMNSTAIQLYSLSTKEIKNRNQIPQGDHCNATDK